MGVGGGDGEGGGQPGLTSDIYFTMFPRQRLFARMRVSRLLLTRFRFTLLTCPWRLTQFRSDNDDDDDGCSAMVCLSCYPLHPPPPRLLLYLVRQTHT